MSPWLLVGVGACAPRIDVGPAPAVRAALPVEIIERPTPNAATLSLAARVHAGSACDPAGAEGLANLTAQAVAAALPGAVVAVDREWVRLSLACPVGGEFACATGFADALGAPASDPSRVVAAREMARTSIERIRLEGALLSQAVLEDLIFEAHPYGHLPAGRTGSLPLLDAAEVAQFHQRFWVRSAVSVEMAGAWTPATTAALTTRFETLAPRLAPDVPLVHPLRAPRLVLVPTDSAEVIVRVGAALRLPVGHADRAALLQGLAVGESSGWQQPYWSHAEPAAPSAEAEAVVRAAIARLERLAGGGLTSEELVPAAGATLPLVQVNAALKAHLVPAEVSMVVVGGDAALALSLTTPREGVAPLPFSAEQVTLMDPDRLFQ